MLIVPKDQIVNQLMCYIPPSKPTKELKWSRLEKVKLLSACQSIVLAIHVSARNVLRSLYCTP